MPKSKNYDSWIKQNYPRKCEHCDYVSNNPSMYHYHKKTHDPIPKGTLCWQGCGQLAKHRGTGGKYTCLPKAQHCPEYIKQHSARIAKQWDGDYERKEKTKERFFEYCCGNDAVKEKQRETLKKKWGNFTPEQMKEYRHYARRLRSRAQKWAKEQGYTLGQQTYHVDHKLSVLDAWKAGLSEEIVNHPANLQILEAKVNSSKGAKSSITVDELIDLINKYTNAY
jgi:hypothetical protein